MLETFRISGRNRQEKIPKSSSSGRESQETAGKFSRFSLGLWIIAKSCHSLCFSAVFVGDSVGGPGLKAVPGGCSHCPSPPSPGWTAVPESSSEVLLESHPHVKLEVALVLWSGISWKCFLCVVSAGWGVLNVLINCRGAHLPDSHFGL